MHKTLGAVLAALVLLVPALFTLSPAATAADPLPNVPSVNWVPQTNLQQYLYLNYPHAGTADSNQPICTAGTGTDPPTRLGHFPREDTDTNPRAECTYTAQRFGGTEGPAETSIASFPTDPLLRTVNFTGNDSIRYEHFGSIPTGMLMTLTLTARGSAGDRPISEVVFEKTEDNDLRVDFPLKDARATLIGRDQTTNPERLVLTLRGTVPSTPTGLPTSPGATWTLSDAGSRLVIRSADAVRAATWMEDEGGNVRSLFRPIANGTFLEARMVGFFAVQSAFGFADANASRARETLETPSFIMERGGRAEPLGPQSSGIIDARWNRTASDMNAGISVWNFADGGIDYHNMPPGEYNLTVDMDYYQGGSFKYGVQSRVLLTAQSVTLAPYDDNDPTTFAPLETNAHPVAPAGTTTYLVLITNTGAVNDTFRVDANFISSTQGGWGATIGGPGVLDRTVKLAPLESKLITLTVAAPLGAPVDSISIFQLVATSLVDPTVRSQPFTIVTTVSNQVRHEVGVVALVREFTVIPGEEPPRHTIYVWNKGTRAANMSIEIKGTIKADWTVELLQGESGVSRIVIPNVKPGDIQSFDVRATGPINRAEESLEVVLNATDLDVSGVTADLPITFVLKPSASVRLDIFSQVPGAGRAHVVEVTGSFQRNPATGEPITDPKCGQPGTRADAVGCDNDGVDGAWYRLWITNTGKRSDQFRLSVESITFAQVRDRCEETVFVPHEYDPAEVAGGFQFYFRRPDGSWNAQTTVSLGAGQTGELYLWRPADRFANPDDCTTPDTYDFVVKVQGIETGAQARQGARIVAEDGTRYSQVFVEAVERARNAQGEFIYSTVSPLVNIANAGKRSVTGGVRPGENATFFVRVTTAASWSNFTRGTTTFSPDVVVTIDGVDTDKGWNASIRPANGERDVNKNPYSNRLTISNINTKVVPNRVEAWYDMEIEVQVQAPNEQNATSALAREQDQFRIVATIPNGDTNSLEIKAVITELAVVNVVADRDQVRAHPGRPGAFLLYVNNTGSSGAPVTLTATMDPATTSEPARWTVEPASQGFQLAAFKNRTIALLVTPPASASPGTTGDVIVRWSYPPDPFRPLNNLTGEKRLSVEVTQLGTLRLVPGQTLQTVGPGGFANFTMTLQNTATQPVTFRATATELPSWTQTLSPIEATLGAQETRTLVYVLRAPLDVLNDSRFNTLVRVQQVGDETNFDVTAFAINIFGGSAIPSLVVPISQKTVDRAGTQTFEVLVKNIGSKSERIALSTRVADPGWTAQVRNSRGDNITGIVVNPNEVQIVNVSVRAPLLVPENTIVNVELLAEAGGLTAPGPMRAIIHDYGVGIELIPARVDAVAGQASEFTVRLRNAGNDNDTLNVSAHLIDLPEWRVEFSTTEVRLEPGLTADVRATVRPPTSPLPPARAYTLKFFVGTRGGQEVNLSKNESIPAVVNVLNYRPLDVDRDEQLELAVDFDKNPGNGFERFYEVFSSGTQSSSVAVGRLDGKSRLFIDVPVDAGAYDGVADVYFDPETVYRFEIRHRPDINGDQSPDYIIDTDRDGKNDTAYDTGGGVFWKVVEIKSYGDDRIQYLVDMNGDGRPDRFFDPETQLVTRTRAIEGNADLIGIDTDNDGRIDKTYNTKTTNVQDIIVSGFSNFFLDYWYFFAAFALLAVVTVLLVVRRRR